MGRKCGSCTACCTLLGVPEIEKDRGVACQFERNGCERYATRPSSCRNFSCMWLMSADFPDELRPDRCGAVLAVFDHVPDRLVLHIDPERLFCWTEQPLRSLLTAFRDSGYSVSITAGDKRLMMLPSTGEANDANIQSGNVPAIA